MRCCVIGYGSMGKLLKSELGPECVCVIAPQSPDLYTSILEYEGKIDVILDFSNPANLNMIYSYAKEHKCGVVIGTTGYTEAEQEKINDLAKTCAVLQSRNFSVGANLVNRIIREITPKIYEYYDIEYIEKGGSDKIEAPCRITSEMLIKSLTETTKGTPKYGREGNNRRESNEIGIHQIRGGDLLDEHDIMYIGEDDMIEIKHTGINKARFARGAIHAAEFVKDAKPGMYNMEDILFKG